MKTYWFVDESGAIRQVIHNENGVSCPSLYYQKLKIEKTPDFDNLLFLVQDNGEWMVDEEYQLWPSLKDLAFRLEGE